MMNQVVIFAEKKGYEKAFYHISLFVTRLHLMFLWNNACKCQFCRIFLQREPNHDY